MCVSAGIFNRAKKIASQSEYYPFKIGAVVFKSNRILSEGKNRVGSSKKIQSRDRFVKCSIHAEADAISKLDPEKVKGASIIVVRINAGTNKMSNAKPCEICQRMIYEKGIKKVYFSDEHGKIVEYKVIKPKERLVVDNEKTEHSYSDKFILRLG